MRVAYLTAGAGGMYCGSCMRDNTLAAALRAQQRDVLLVPLYTPIHTDEPDVSEHCVLYGGINVYLQQKSAVFRHTPRLFDRLLDSPRLLRRVVHDAGGHSTDQLAELTLSMLRGPEGAQHKELTRLIRWLRRHRVNLVNLPNAMFLGAARTIREALGVPVFCTLTGEDLFLDALPPAAQEQAHELIRRHAVSVNAFVAVSHYYAAHTGERFGIAAERMHVVPLGVRVDGEPDPAEPAPATFTIGFLARICPEKGLHVLCAAFRLLRRAGRDCRLRIAGYLPSDQRAYLQALLREARTDGDQAVEYLPELDLAAKRRFLRSLSVLSVPTVYREAKGLYVLEALAAGVPVVQPDHGAFPELIAATGGGLLCAPEDPTALAEALGRLMDNPGLRDELGQRGRSAVHQAHTDHVMAERTWRLYEQYAQNLTVAPPPP